MQSEKALFTGKKGFYTIELFDADAGVTAKAWGPIPFQGAGWTSMVASATGKDRDEALRLVVAELQRLGA